MGGDNINLRTQMGEEPKFTERPRPSLYQVIKKLKEMKGPMVNRLCYMAKINEHAFKGDLEKELTSWTQNVCAKLDGNSEDDPAEYTGYAILLGPWVVHLFEAEGPLMT